MKRPTIEELDFIAKKVIEKRKKAYKMQGKKYKGNLLETIEQIDEAFTVWEKIKLGE